MLRVRVLKDFKVLWVLRVFRAFKGLGSRV